MAKLITDKRYFKILKDNGVYTNSYFHENKDRIKSAISATNSFDDAVSIIGNSNKL